MKTVFQRISGAPFDRDWTLHPNIFSNVLSQSFFAALLLKLPIHAEVPSTEASGTHSQSS